MTPFTENLKGYARHSVFADEPVFSTFSRVKSGGQDDQRT